MQEKYYPLKNIFHQSNERYKEELELRKNSYGCYDTNLEITPIANEKLSHENINLFLVNTKKLQSLLQEAMKNSKKIESGSRKLPRHALQQYFDSLLINELQSTNEIEGVQSTKKEIADAIVEIVNNNKVDRSTKRFIGLVKLYGYVSDETEITNILQFREIYDELVSDEVDDECKLDGEIFRKSFVGVQKNGAFVHKGVEPEARIIDYLNRLINFIQNNSMPDLFKYMVAHYYFEYIHPFYDGNGRTGRYLVCSWIGKTLDRFSSITLSYIINRHKDEYYKAFEQASHPLNAGEITFFCEKMLEFLIEGQKRIIEDMEEKENKLNVMLRNIKELSGKDKELNDNDCGILFIITQSWLFSRKDKRVTNSELIEMETFGKRTKVINAIQKMEEKNYLVKIGNRPLRYTLTQEFASHLLNED
ncbi:Fic family protein [Listeria welshimeri]|uniref:Fic family protein n=1 Tax=Listeria welshimeri TaxID=1643 RepID=A0A7X0T3T8_LISWE|nr:Fic family protein [Listeria welshimeri]MBC1319691.1 Fic family protein [Listeria welshimeri]MBC1322076.1 Fic family protein [Listeria welshimeri]MBC1410834.1 Fic family protein [Listeria welshimeri]MBC1478287.1 Fic family protein [Listeria welshimeri]MBC1625611.1 Fic family protein [Listeria welshimeri]